MYIEAPEYKPLTNDKKSVFLAGSISNASDWQKTALDALKDQYHVINPRRENYSSLVPYAELEQITWEHHYLNRADIILFYFSWETVAPITLFEYGATLERLNSRYAQKVVVAIHPDYSRKNDVRIQTQLRHPDLLPYIYNSLDAALDYLARNKLGLSEKQIIDIFCFQMNLLSNSFTIDSTLSSIGADSLDVVELIMAFEEAQAGKKIPESRFAHIEDLSAITIREFAKLCCLQYSE